MNDEENNQELFEELFKDKLEKKIMVHIVEGKDDEEIIDLIIKSTKD